MFAPNRWLSVIRYRRDSRSPRTSGGTRRNVSQLLAFGLLSERLRNRRDRPTSKVERYSLVSPADVRRLSLDVQF